MERVLTGIKPTGTPHVGNLLGAIRPALRLADGTREAMYFIADYHALTTEHDAAAMRAATYEVAATWLAMGLDPERVIFYRQSDIPEVFELTWALACFTSKGWMNKMHAYKAISEQGDDNINVGIYLYPVLMAADIMLFDVDLVPVGKDQVQHVEIARDMAQRLNHVAKREVLKLPKAMLEAHAHIVPGTDGRKMSKSYDNTIPLFAPTKQLDKIVKSIKTDSLPPEAPKDPDTSTIFQIYRAVASKEECDALAERYRTGIGWGDAKKALSERLEAELAAPRERYLALMADKPKIDAILAAGAARARPYARKVLDRVREAIGIAK